jgi:transketolase
MDNAEKKCLAATATQVRLSIVRAIGNVGIGHLGGALSIVELLVVLYYRSMSVDPENPRDPDRDKLVLSKGHAGPALYAVLAEKGFFPKDLLLSLNQGGTSLPSHCDANLTRGIDMTTGSLGQGLSAAIGIALGDRADGRKNTVFAIIGDGESNEGQIWEAAMAASHFGLANLVAFTDYNKMNIDGYTRDIMNLEDLGARWKAFNWNVLRADGHDFEAIDHAIGEARKETRRPSMIILDTVKGKGCSLTEGKLSSHNMNITKEQTEQALEELSARGGGAL